MKKNNQPKNLKNPTNKIKSFSTQESIRSETYPPHSIHPLEKKKEKIPYSTFLKRKENPKETRSSSYPVNQVAACCKKQLEKQREIYPVAKKVKKKKN